MSRLTPCVLSCLLLAGCAAAPPPPADPQAVFAAAFATPPAAVTVEASGGSTADAWLIFTTAERLELRDGERYAVMPPGAAVAHFTTAAPAQVASLPAEGLVCLAWRDVAAGADSGASLLFELGSGRYFFRRWGAPAAG